MSELRYTDTNAADDSAGRVFGLTGNLYLAPVIAAVAGVGLFAMLGFVLRVGFVVAGIVSAVPVAAVIGWVVLLKHGKPAGHDRDLLDHLLGRGSFTRISDGETFARAHDQLPDGWFVDGMLVFGALERGGLVAKGFWIEPGDLRGASHERRNAFHEQLRGMLALATPGRRLQIQWWPDSDYRGPLARYHGVTQTTEDTVVRRLRNERFTRYWPRMLAGSVRRERLAVFVSIEISGYSGNVRSRDGVLKHYGTLLRGLGGEFEEFAGTLRTVFGPETPVRPMDDAAHFACIRRFLNPTTAQRGDAAVESIFDPARTIQENCWLGEGVGQPDGGFVLDGCHHAILALDRWPRRTRPGIVTHLTGLPFLDCAITVNITPAVARREIDREEKAAERLRGEYADRSRPSLLVALRKKERKVEALSGGFTRPFHVTYLIRVWAPAKESLRERISAVQAAVNAMDGAQVFECALPTTAKKLFVGSWPGWTHSSYHHRELYAEDSYLADVLPFSATFTGALDAAEAIYDGGHLNLVGVSTQAGGSPQHALVCGMTGSGKSEFIDDLFFQTAGLFHHTLIADIGFSHAKLTKALGETPIVIHPDSDLTLNYLDTQGAPLTQLHLATAVALLARMVGVPDDPQELALRQAQLVPYVQQLYRDTFTDWARRFPGKAEEVRRLACAVHRWRQRMPGGTTPLDAFADLRERKGAWEEEAVIFVRAIPDSDVIRFAQEPATERFVWQTACAFYSTEEYPTHSALVELLAYARLPEHPQMDIERLATLLRAWSADGQYGKLFDGQSTVSLNRRIAHFELGLIPEQAFELKAAAGLLISGLSRQHIISLPRALRKRVLYEEVSRFCDVPGGEQIIAESYEQLRKHNCWAVSVVQQYAQFRSSRVRSAVIGNAKQFFLLRQSDRRDMEDLAGDVGLPETAVEAIQRYPLPEQQPAEARFSSVCCFTPTSQPPQCGTLRHVQPKEDAYAPLASA